MQKFHNFTRSKFDLQIKWITRKTKTLFKLKNKCLQPAYEIYHSFTAVYHSCEETYLGETITNEHNMPSEKSNLSKHLNTNITDHFSWLVICSAPV